MNTKLFIVSLLVALGMLIWNINQEGSIPFQTVRAAIALVSIIFAFFSLNWNEKNWLKRIVIIVLVVLTTILLILFAFNWGFKHYLIETGILLIVLGVVSIIAISKQNTKVPAK